MDEIFPFFDKKILLCKFFFGLIISYLSLQWPFSLSFFSPSIFNSFSVLVLELIGNSMQFRTGQIIHRSSHITANAIGK